MWLCLHALAKQTLVRTSTTSAPSVKQLPPAVPSLKIPPTLAHGCVFARPQVTSLRIAPPGFDAHFSSLGKTYAYHITTGVPDPCKVRAQAARELAADCPAHG
jgi:hypothetical protein